MPLRYTIAVDLQTTGLTALDFLKCGTKLAAVSQDGIIKVWDVSSRSIYSPSSGPGGEFTPSKSHILWVSETTFICAFADGNTLTGCLEKKPGGAKEELTLRSKRLADHPIRMMSFDPHAAMLAVGDDDGVRLWKMREELHAAVYTVFTTRWLTLFLTEGVNDWEYDRDLPSPRQDRNECDKLGVTVVAWIESGILLVAYLRTGFVIWNTMTLSIERSFQPQSDRQICDGTFCQEAEKLVALNELSTVDIYDIFSGEPWSPPQLDNVFSVKSLHGGTGFLAGRYNQAEWVDISKTHVSQVLRQGTSGLDRIVALSVYDDQREGEFNMIVTASSQSSIIWKVEESGVLEDPEVPNTKRPLLFEANWFSWFAKRA